MKTLWIGYVCIHTEKRDIKMFQHTDGKLSHWRKTFVRWDIAEYWIVLHLFCCDDTNGHATRYCCEIVLIIFLCEYKLIRVCVCGESNRIDHYRLRMLQYHTAQGAETISLRADTGWHPSWLNWNENKKQHIYQLRKRTLCSSLFSSSSSSCCCCCWKYCVRSLLSYLMYVWWEHGSYHAFHFDIRHIIKNSF